MNRPSQEVAGANQEDEDKLNPRLCVCVCNCINAGCINMYGEREQANPQWPDL